MGQNGYTVPFLSILTFYVADSRCGRDECSRLYCPILDVFGSFICTYGRRTTTSLRGLPACPFCSFWARFPAEPLVFAAFRRISRRFRESSELRLLNSSPNNLQRFEASGAGREPRKCGHCGRWTHPVERARTREIRGKLAGIGGKSLNRHHDLPKSPQRATI